MSGYDAEAFDAYESAGWEDVAAFYAEHWSALTSQTVDALLDAAGVGRGTRVLDVGTGAGAAAGRAVERGASATGVDVAVAMLEIAARSHPAVTFIQASATQLPFVEESFDAAVGNIVIQHVGQPEQAVKELERVLVSGGRLALSTWDAPDRSPFFGALLGAVSDAGVPAPDDVPPGPSFFQFADEAAFRGLLEAAGFIAVDVASTSVDFRVRSADEVIRALAEGTVRTGALVRAADDMQRHRVRESLEARLEPWRDHAGYLIPASVRIAAGTKR